LSMEQDFMAKLGAGLQSNQASLTSAMSIELQALEKRNLKRIEALSKDIPELIRAELAPKLANHGERISMQEGRLATIKNFVENLEATSDDRIRGIGAKLTTEIERLENHFSSELDSRIMNTREYASRSFAESAEREKQLQEGLANLRTALQDTRSTMSREFEEQLDTRIHDIGQESTNRMLDLVMGLGNVCETAASRLTIPAGQPAKLPNQQSDIPTTETDAKAQRLIPGVSSQQESVPEKITTPASPDDNGSKVTKWRNIRTLFQTTGAKSGQ